MDVTQEQFYNFIKNCRTRDTIEIIIISNHNKSYNGNVLI